GQQHRHASAHGRSAHGRHDGFGEAADAVQKAKHRRVGCGRRIVQEIADVVTGGKNGFMALNHHRAHGGVVKGGFQCIGQGAIHGGGDGVFLVHAAQRDGHHARVNVAEDFRNGGGNGRRRCAHDDFSVKGPSVGTVDNQSGLFLVINNLG